MKPAVDKSVERVQTKLASMLNRLELEIQSVEKRIGDKMHVLDRDKDGMVSAEEIAHVVQHVLATASTEQEAKAIAQDVSTLVLSYSSGPSIVPIDKCRLPDIVPVNSLDTHNNICRVVPVAAIEPVSPAINSTNRHRAQGCSRRCEHVRLALWRA